MVSQGLDAWVRETRFRERQGHSPNLEAFSWFRRGERDDLPGLIYYHPYTRGRIFIGIFPLLVPFGAGTNLAYFRVTWFDTVYHSHARCRHTKVIFHQSLGSVPCWKTPMVKPIDEMIVDPPRDEWKVSCLGSGYASGYSLVLTASDQRGLDIIRKIRREGAPP
jgi:hypothetical protein